MKKATILSVLILFVSFGFWSCSKDEDPIASVTAFSITTPVSAFGIIDATASTITLSVPYGTKLNNVVGTVTLSEATAKISPDITLGVDLSSLSVPFTITNGTQTKMYTVKVVVGENPLRIALVGDAASLSAITNPEIKKAYEWAIATYGNEAGYLSLASLTAKDLETAKVLWFHYDASPKDLPASATGSSLTIIKNFYKAGGDLLLTTHASAYLVNLGRLTADLGPTGGGDGAGSNANPDNWGISFSKIDATHDYFAAGNENHAIFKNIATSNVTFEGLTYPACFLVDGGKKKDHSFLWDFNNVAAVKAVVPDPAAPNARKVKFEELAGAVVRASFEWDPAANGVELGTIIEFKTKGDYAGKAITISLGAYEWDQPDGRTNAFANNVKTITKNSLTYLKDN